MCIFFKYLHWYVQYNYDQIESSKFPNTELIGLVFWAHVELSSNIGQVCFLIMFRMTYGDGKVLTPQ